jgi:glycosyltransferase involved in cell wall biosynthesis/cephalosporin hydroxylase
MCSLTGASVGAYVPCFNDTATLRRSVESVLGQTVRPAEVLVVDDGSADDVTPALRGLDVRTIRHDRNLGRGAARARAMAELHQEFVLCCDAPNILAPTFVENALPWFEDPRVAAVYGQITQRPARNAAERWRGRHLFKLDVQREIRHGAPLATFGALVRGSAVRAVGGYDVRLRHTEDGELGARLLAHNFDVVYDPRLEVQSIASDTVNDVLERYWRWYAGPDERVTWVGYWKNVGYAIRSEAVMDLRAGDPAGAVISLACPHYAFWRSRWRTGRHRGSGGPRMSREVRRTRPSRERLLEAAAENSGLTRRLFGRLRGLRGVGPLVYRAEIFVKDWSFRLDGARQSMMRQELQSCGTPEELLGFIQEHIPAGQKTSEIVEFARFARDLAPKVFCEIGTMCGGTHLFMTQALPTVNASIAIDLLIQNKGQLRLLARAGLDSYFVQGPSAAGKTVARVVSILSGREIDLLFIDGDHRYEGVRADFLIYRRFVRDGGVVAFHDICEDYRARYGRETGQDAGGVPALWRRLRSHYEHREFVESPDQDGFGIGALIHSQAVTPPDDL